MNRHAPLTLASRLRWDRRRRRWVAILGHSNTAGRGRLREVLAPPRFGEHDQADARQWFAVEQRRRAPDLQPAPGDTMLAVCTRIGQAASVPPDYETADCQACRSAVWISPGLPELARRMGLGVVVICEDCLGKGR